MKTRIFLMLLLLVAVVFSCQKEKEPVATQQEVSFSATIVEPDLKNSEDWLCVADGIPTHAWIEIVWPDGTVHTYFPEIFTLDGKLYTQALKLDATEGAEEYCVTEFLLYEEVNGEDGYQPPSDPPAVDDDILCYGVPYSEDANGDPTYYGVYVDVPLPYCFIVNAFEKKEIYIEVLCFEEADYDDFGFFWFNITEIVVREFCFFGDICLNGVPELYIPSYFNNSPYPYGNLSEIEIDEIALFKLEVLKSNEAGGYVQVGNSPYYNHTYNDTTGLYTLVPGPLCGDYPDNLSTPNETFYYQISVLVWNGTAWVYVPYGEKFHVTDDGLLFYDDWTTGWANTTAISFAVGTCSPDSDVVWDW